MALINILGAAGLKLVSIHPHGGILVAPQAMITTAMRELISNNKLVIMRMVMGDVSRKEVFSQDSSQGSYRSLAGFPRGRDGSLLPSPKVHLQDFQATGYDCPWCGGLTFLADYTVGGWTCEGCQANFSTIGGTEGPLILRGDTPAGCRGCHRLEVLSFVGPGCLYGSAWKGFAAMEVCPHAADSDTGMPCQAPEHKPVKKLLA